MAIVNIRRAKLRPIRILLHFLQLYIFANIRFGKRHFVFNGLKIKHIDPALKIILLSDRYCPSTIIGYHNTNNIILRLNLLIDRKILKLRLKILKSWIRFPKLINRSVGHTTGVILIDTLVIVIGTVTPTEVLNFVYFVDCPILLVVF